MTIERLALQRRIRNRGRFLVRRERNVDGAVMVANAFGVCRTHRLGGPSGLQS